MTSVLKRVLVFSLIGSLVAAAQPNEFKDIAGVSGKDRITQIHITNSSCPMESCAVWRAVWDMEFQFRQTELTKPFSRGLEVAHELINALLVLDLTEGGQVSMDDGGGGAVMAEVDLQLAEVFALFQQMGSIAVAQRLLTLLISSRCKQYITGITRITELKSP